MPARRTVLGVGGGIAAYKAASLLRLLIEAGNDVTVVPTAAALRFVGAATWEALSHRAVASEVWAGVPEVAHVAIGRETELVVIAPATADLLGRAAGGLADDLLTNVLLTARAPVLMAPAMHTEMWEHPAVQANVATLRGRGVVVLEPGEGRLTGTDTGKGPPARAGGDLRDGRPAAAPSRRVAPRPGRSHRGHHRRRDSRAARPGALPRQQLLRPAGSRWPPSPPHGGAGATGRRQRRPAGARVGVEVERVGSAEQLQVATTKAAADTDVVAMVAAVADFRPAQRAEHKIKKRRREPDSSRSCAIPIILAGMVAERAGSRPLLVGFAAETGDASGDPLAYGRRKLADKGCDLMVVNRVGDQHAFGRPDNAAVILGSDGTETEVPLGPKAVLAATVWDVVAPRLGQ
jgi:phosphopantothenoylcysteine decarboxylase/phosphopantothenate--cysteine ligase